MAHFGSLCRGLSRPVLSWGEIIRDEERRDLPISALFTLPIFIPTAITDAFTI
jgi:hypothetical protein